MVFLNSKQNKKNPHTQKQNQDEKLADAKLQPRRLSIRRPSYKREVVDVEHFTDILLKPVVKEKVEPQSANKDFGKLTKVKTINASIKRFIFIEQKFEFF